MGALRSVLVGRRRIDARGLFGLDMRELRVLIATDPPNHTRLRPLLSRAFPPPAISELEPHLRPVFPEPVADLLTPPASRPCALLPPPPFPFPSLVLAPLHRIPPQPLRHRRPRLPAGVPVPSHRHRRAARHPPPSGATTSSDGPTHSSAHCRATGTPSRPSKRWPRCSCTSPTSWSVAARSQVTTSSAASSQAPTPTIPTASAPSRSRCSRCCCSWPATRPPPTCSATARQRLPPTPTRPASFAPAPISWDRPSRRSSAGTRRSRPCSDRPHDRSPSPASTCARKEHTSELQSLMHHC